MSCFLHKTDQNDESLRKWKESLGLGSGTPIGDPNDKRTVIMLSLSLEVQGRPDIVVNLEAPGALDTLKGKPFTIKEGSEFRMKVSFRVQHQILSGMKYVQVVKKGIISNKSQEMIGSYSPNTTDKRQYEKTCMSTAAKPCLTESALMLLLVESETAPSGMLARGHYTASSKFVDDDNQTHLQFSWSFDIKKDWDK